jgi:hypothetical protein
VDLYSRILDISERASDRPPAARGAYPGRDHEGERRGPP